jgi:D-2-hydroxyacid dehydrogenase (NADP+)
LIGRASWGTRASMKVIYFHEVGRPPDDVEQMFGAFPQVSFTLARNAAELTNAMADADILIVNNRSYTAANAKLIRDHGRALRWIQFTTSGIDNAVKHGLPAGVVVTNMAGLRAFAVAEHALMLMLALVRRLRVTERARVTDYWIREDVTPSMDNLAGKHLVIIGLGEIGQAIARKAKAFDMQVSGVSRAAEPVPNVDRVRPRSELIPACAEADIVVVAAMHDASTDKIVSHDVIAAMRPTAYLINIARGQLVDEPALIEALRAGKLAGAGLDVAATEPLPAGHPFWAMDNVILTPHVGGAGNRGVGGGLASIFADNLRRWLDGKPLTKVVVPHAP